MILQPTELLPAVGSPGPSEEKKQDVLTAPVVCQPNLPAIGQAKAEVRRRISNAKDAVFSRHQEPFPTTSIPQA